MSKVERIENGARFDIKIQPQVGTRGTAFRKQFIATNKQLGDFDRIGIERSGRQGGDALFDSVEIQLGQ